MDEAASSAPQTPESGTVARATRIAFRWVRAATETRSLVLLALVVRLLAAATEPAVENDAAGLVRGAARVAAEGPRALLEIPHHPLPPALLAAAGRFVDPLLAGTLMAAIASSLAVWPLHALARRACGRHAATATCILYVVLPKAVAVGSMPIAEGFFLAPFLGALALAAAGRDAGPRITRRLFGAGCMAGLAYLCRPEGLVAFPGALAVAALDGRPGRLRRAGLVAAGFLLLAVPYVSALSAHRGTLALTPKKDVIRFVGVESPRPGEPARAAPIPAPAPPAPETRSVGEVVGGVSGAVDSALPLPVLIAVLIGLLGPRRWRRRRARRPRLLLAGTALLLLALLVRLEAGWGYASGRHALAAGCVLLTFAGQGLATLGSVLPRVTSRRRFAIVAAALLAMPLGARAILRPAGEGGAAARRLGEEIARVEVPGGVVRVATVAEPLVAFYADRALAAAGGSAQDVPLWGRFVRPVERGAPLDAVAEALADELRAEADWVVLDVARGLDRHDDASLALARALRERGVLGSPALATGSHLAAFPVRR